MHVQIYVCFFHTPQHKCTHVSFAAQCVLWGVLILYLFVYLAWITWLNVYGESSFYCRRVEWGTEAVTCCFMWSCSTWGAFLQLLGAVRILRQALLCLVLILFPCVGSNGSDPSESRAMFHVTAEGCVALLGLKEWWVLVKVNCSVNI